MRFFNSHFAAALSLTAILGHLVAASLSSATKNEVFLATEEGLVQPTEDLFKKLTDGPRKHSVLVQFTVLGGSFDCKVCHIVNDILKQVSKAVGKSDHNEDLYLVSLDYATAAKVFAKYKITSAPILYLFPATEKATENPDFVEFKGVGPKMEPETLIRYIEESLGVKIPYTKPIDYKKLGMQLATGVASLLLAYLVFMRLSVVAYSSKSWASASLVFILAMISGQMWNSIRGANYIGSGRDGSIEWFAGGFQEQLGVESQIVAGVYGVATFALVLLGTHAPKIKNPTIQSFVSIFLMAVFVGCLSFITALFKRKFSPYPYKIFFQ